MVLRWIETAVGLALSGTVGGVVTAPIAKAPLYAAGFAFAGHTEFLDELTASAPCDGRRGPVMMLSAAGLRTALVTIHSPVSAVPALIDRESVVRTGVITAQALERDFGVTSPRLVVTGLNPHAGEGGAIGREEIDQIAPAVADLVAMGYRVRGPLPADTLFHPEARAGYDAGGVHVSRSSPHPSEDAGLLERG